MQENNTMRTDAENLSGRASGTDGSAGIVVRRMEAGEAEAVSALEAECFPDPWSAHSLQDMLGNPHSMYLVAVSGEKVIGYLGSGTVLDEGDIYRVAVKANVRRQGVGTALFRELFRCTPDIVSWNLDVREHNAPAIGLYKSFGFVPVAKRKGYYKHPDEDAVIMQLQRRP